MSPEFRQGERETHISLKCTECGGEAEGNVSWTDGSGEVCDKCDKLMQAADEAEGHVHVSNQAVVAVVVVS